MTAPSNSARKAKASTDKYLTMSRQALGQGATFIIWPESSTPFYFEHDLLRGGSIRRLAREGASVTLLARRNDRLDALVNEIRESGGTPRGAR